MLVFNEINRLNNQIEILTYKGERKKGEGYVKGNVCLGENFSENFLIEGEGNNFERPVGEDLIGPKQKCD